MAISGQEALGSMGTDTPISAISSKAKLLYTYFKQNFAQVTNPPIDSLREQIVMSLKTRLGNLGNIADADAEQLNLVLLESPVLLNHELNSLKITLGKKYNSN